MGRVEQRAEEFRAEQERSRERERTEREQRDAWFEGVHQRLRRELKAKLDEATGERAEIAEPFVDWGSDSAISIHPQLGVWYSKEMLGRVVRKHVANVEIDRINTAPDGGARLTVYLDKATPPLLSPRTGLSLAEAVDLTITSTVDAMAQSIFAGCNIVFPASRDEAT
jgi:hypothetical protein